jgi:hypothetical protein
LEEEASPGAAEVSGGGEGGSGGAAEKSIAAGCSAVSAAAAELVAAVLSHAATVEFLAVSAAATGVGFGFGGAGVGAMCIGLRMARRMGDDSEEVSVSVGMEHCEKGKMCSTKVTWREM